ncbi:nucleoporin protein Ndc1-Nup [Myxozyma melibiosi]|uniref:Nucleoporin protein Ndc1-Nup n=1 Tax=Myxozyma melibiosi TaxID=54550 RepID=A0ABR1F4L7_9ASCO
MAAGPRAFPQTSSGRADATHYHVLYSGVLQIRFAMLVKTTFFMIYFPNCVLTFFRYGWVWALIPFRAIVLTAGIFGIYVLRKARLHVDDRTPPSLLYQLKQRIFCKSYSRILIVYSFYVALFLFFYCREFSGLTVFAPKKAFELYRLNEKRVSLSVLALVDAAIFSAYYCWFDLDRIQLSNVKDDPMQEVLRSVVPSITLALKLSVLSILSFVTVIYPSVRSSVWIFSLNIARFFTKFNKEHELHRSNIMGPFPFPIFHWFLFTFLLFFSWRMANYMFNIYLARGSRHRGKLISEKSSDPNGSLITGLRSTKRLFTKRTAFQELAYIAQNDGRRRDNIYRDIEKPTIWSQICSECISVVTDMRNMFSLDKKAVAGKTNAPAASRPPIQPTPSSSPTPVTIKPRKDNIFVSSRASPVASVENRVLKSVQDPQAVQSTVVIGWLDQLQATAKAWFKAANAYREIFLKHPISIPFRWTIERKVARLASNKDMYSDAVTALSYFLDYSLAEDTYGTVQHDIPRIMNELEITMTALEKFQMNQPLEPSDTAAWLYRESAGKPIDLPELNEIYDITEEGFLRIYQRFAEYLHDIPLTSNVKQRCQSYAAQF